MFHVNTTGHQQEVVPPVGKSSSQNSNRNSHFHLCIAPPPHQFQSDKTDGSVECWERTSDVRSQVDTLGSALSQVDL